MGLAYEVSSFNSVPRDFSGIKNYKLKLKLKTSIYIPRPSVKI